MAAVAPDAAPKMKTVKLAKRVDPYEAAHYESPHLDLPCFFSISVFSFFSFLVIFRLLYFVASYGLIHVLRFLAGLERSFTPAKQTNK